MPGKITGYTSSEPLSPPKGAVTGSVVPEKLPVESAPGTAAAAQSGDQLTLTPSARSLQKLADAVAAAPAVDAAKVAAVKQALANGTYAIDSKRIADKLLKLDGSLK